MSVLQAVMLTSLPPEGEEMAPLITTGCTVKLPLKEQVHSKDGEVQGKRNGGARAPFPKVPGVCFPFTGDCLPPATTHHHCARAEPRAGPFLVLAQSPRKAAGFSPPADAAFGIPF